MTKRTVATIGVWLAAAIACAVYDALGVPVDAALKGAAPLSDNAYKVPIAKALVRRAILRASGSQETG